MAVEAERQSDTDRLPWYRTVHGPVFWPAAAIVIVFVVAAAVWPTTMNDDVMAPVQMWIVEWFGSYYTLLVTGFVAFSLWIGLGHFGDIKLGKDDDEPEFGVLSWFCMLFAAGMGIGLVFWGVAEPLSHYAGDRKSVV